MRRALVIVGPHRAGTSALAKALSCAGFALPKTLLPGGPGNIDGHFESLPIMRFNEAVLRHQDREWLDPKPLPDSFSPRPDAISEAASILTSEFGDAGAILIKEPRMSRLLPLWLAALSELGIRPAVLVACREARAAADSLRRRDGFDLAHGLELWLTHVLEAELASRGIPRHAIHYERLLAHPVQVITEALTAVGWALPSGPNWAADLRQVVRPHVASATAGGASVRLDRAVDAVERVLAAVQSLSNPSPFDEARLAWRRFWAAASPGDGASFLALGSAETHFGRSAAELAAGRPIAALAAARMANNLAPDNPIYWNQTGIIAAAAGEPAEAEVALRQTLALDAENVTALHQLGLIELNAGRAASARGLFERAVDLAPRNAGLHHAVGVSAQAAGDFAAAAVAFAKAKAIEAGK